MISWNQQRYFDGFGKDTFLTPQIAFATLSDHPHHLLLDAPVDSLVKVLLKNYWQYKWVQYFCSNTIIKKTGSNIASDLNIAALSAICPCQYFCTPPFFVHLATLELTIWCFHINICAIDYCCQIKTGKVSTMNRN